MNPMPPPLRSVMRLRGGDEVTSGWARGWAEYHGWCLRSGWLGGIARGPRGGITLPVGGPTVEDCAISTRARSSSPALLEELTTNPVFGPAKPVHGSDLRALIERAWVRKAPLYGTQPQSSAEAG